MVVAALRGVLRIAARTDVEQMHEANEDTGTNDGVIDTSDTTLMFNRATDTDTFSACRFGPYDDPAPSHPIHLGWPK